MFRCYLALGSNLGDRMGHLRAGLSGLEAHGVSVLRTASVYSTQPKEILSQPWFLNTAVEAETELEAEDLMRACLEIEHSSQRQRDLPNGPRTLDIDIILFDNHVVQSEGLKIPHPRYTERRFVLQPLSEIASDQMDPVRNQTVGRLLEAVQDASTVDLFAPPLTINP
jgi:2-amino-4-hydroxy-6-hydroxymethyldihydropteridine diphosphokinase